jgi:hypothetical protein
MGEGGGTGHHPIWRLVLVAAGDGICKLHFIKIPQVFELLQIGPFRHFQRGQLMVVSP